MEYRALAGFAEPPPDSAGRGLEGGNERVQAHFAKGNNDAEGRHGALPAVQHGHGDSPRVRVYDAGQLRIALTGSFAKEGAEVLGEPSVRSDR